MYVCIPMFTYVYTHIYIYIYMYAHIYIYIYTCMYVYLSLSMYIYMQTYTDETESRRTPRYDPSGLVQRHSITELPPPGTV